MSAAVELMCRRCEFCWSRAYGCTGSDYCHTHELEPAEPRTRTRDALDELLGGEQA